MESERTVTNQTTDAPATSDLQQLRVDNVGSMLRPPALIAAFERFVRGEAGEGELTAAQDEAIEALVAHQERIGFPVVVDGEFRRVAYMESFSRVEGSRDWRRLPQGERPGHEDLTEDDEEADDPTQHSGWRVPTTKRLRLIENGPLAELSFTQRQTERPVKVTLIGPDRVQSMHDIDVPGSAYEDADAFMDDVVAIERQIVGGLVDGGCRYVHIDEPGFTAYVDDAALAEMRERGEDPDVLLDRSIAANNALIDGFPGVTFGVHLCRGNRESQWHREGSYDAIAERVLGGLHYDRLLLEYDTERAGGFEPLRFARDGATVVLGLLTTKHGELEDRDLLKRRIEEASRFIDIERLAISPQCGFASGLEGNRISEDDQWRKLERVLEVAGDVWG
jgi:5-methyltetrahydropteroyltriglutamate--homocysteine methyltransferase